MSPRGAERPRGLVALVEAQLRLHASACRAADLEAQYLEAIGDTEGLTAHRAAEDRRRAAFQDALIRQYTDLGYRLQLEPTPEGYPALHALTRPEAA